MRHLALCLLFWHGLALAAPDLTTADGMRATCAALAPEPAVLRSDAERQAWVVCNDIALLKQVIGWLKWGVKEMGRRPAPETVRAELRKELIHVRDQLARSRQVLAALRLADGQGLELVPGQWQDDLDGDGRIDPWERHFFAIPRRGVASFDVRLPSNDPEYYRTHYALDARIKVDRADVLWALAYHQFAEGLMELLLAHQLNLGAGEGRWIELRDPVGMRRAHRLVADGLATSTAMRRAVLAETDDEDEWIPAPQQRNTVFPLELDRQAFDRWAEFLREFASLWSGKALLVVEGDAGGWLGNAAKLCPRGQGLDVDRLFRQPARYPFAAGALADACRRPDAHHRVSALPRMLEQAAERGRADPRSPEWHFVRYLYWVN